MDGVVYVKAISRPSKKILLMKYFRKKKVTKMGVRFRIRDELNWMQNG